MPGMRQSVATEAGWCSMIARCSAVLALVLFIRFKPVAWFGSMPPWTTSQSMMCPKPCFEAWVAHGPR